MGSVTGPLAGVVVVDLSRVLAGPFATMMMADLGATVIKVEKPGTGDDSRGYGPFTSDDESYYFARVNRGKRSVVVDLKAEPDVVRALVARADVLVENFRPGVMDRLGLGYADLEPTRPSLVYASISGFGATGPWAHRPAYDAVVQAESGLMAITGVPDGEATKPGAPIADLSAGLHAFGGICAALVHARATGEGTHLDVAMYDASTALLEGAALRWLAHGVEPLRIGNAHAAIAPFDTFRCGDGVLITICAANDALFGALAAVLGAPALLRDRRFARNRDRHEHRAELTTALEVALAARSAPAWVELLQAAGIPCGPVATVGGALDSEQTAARNMVVDAGSLRVPGQPLKFTAWPDPATRPPAPLLDADGPDVRAALASGGSLPGPPSCAPSWS